jgi:6-pyruvoyltetrahydropterin/6-carboxytetrahydropterin synthase
MEIYKEFSFEAAHLLPNTPDGHKCRRLHGHSYRVEVHVDGPLQKGTEWVCDFNDLRVAWSPLHEQLDHHYLNEVEGLANPTSEVLARWIWRQLKPRLPILSKVIVKETCTSGCIYQGEGA